MIKEDISFPKLDTEYEFYIGSGEQITARVSYYQIHISELARVSVAKVTYEINGYDINPERVVKLPPGNIEVMITGLESSNSKVHDKIKRDVAQDIRLRKYGVFKHPVYYNKKRKR